MFYIPWSDEGNTLPLLLAYFISLGLLKLHQFSLIINVASLYSIKARALIRYLKLPGLVNVTPGLIL